jgi:DNA-binding XRE family transcriptional regulator
MIHNDQQLAIVNGQIEDLKKRLTRLRAATDRNPNLIKYEIAGVEGLIDRLQAEVEAYLQARSARLPEALTAAVQDGDFHEVARALVQLRAARGLTQTELARQVGKRQPNIARWESEGYEGYTLKELSSLVAALGRELRVSFVAKEAT